ncbi:TPA: sucrose-6-phosphate hydrolase [Klebsiella pneumoniae]|nr:sucrose-6-phosphate hydrolase [Klebsiella pneumoniae]
MKEIHLLKQTAKSLMSGMTLATTDPHRPAWHLAPPVGLLNDPNGFIQFEGRYHLFYQWNPLACAHGAKFWGHWSSEDLVHWCHEAPALIPSEEYEANGCYSGSAVNNNGVLTLIYTGNVKFGGGRTAWQCLAEMNDQYEFTKLGPVLGLPAGYTGHVRDPKVWEHDGEWWMVLGAQDIALHGKTLLFRSPDLHVWSFVNEIAGSGLNGLPAFGYMWECPDLFHIADQDILIVCPQGLESEGIRYLNLLQSGYFCGTLNYDTGGYQHGEFHELDLGFDFYAPQTMCSEDGRRLLFGWMGMADNDEFSQPTVEYGWIHTMTCPRELSWESGKLYQRPVKELQSLRTDRRDFNNIASQLPKLTTETAEFMITGEGQFNLNFADILHLKCDEQGITLMRTHPEGTRYWKGKVSSVQILCDRSSVEIFINDGESVMSSRYFPSGEPFAKFAGDAFLEVTIWRLKKMC